MPERRAKPPRFALQYRHPLATGLVEAWLCTERGGSLARGSRRGYNATLGGGLGWTIGRLGTALDGGTGKYAQVARNSNLEPTKFTIVCIADTSNADAVYRRLVVKQFDNGGTQRASYSLNLTDSHQIEIRMQELGGSTDTATSSTTNWNDGVPHVFAGTFDGTTLRVYVDGKLQASSTALFSVPNYTGATDLYIGAFNNSALQPWPGRIYMVGLWSRVWTPQEHAMFVQRPWDLWIPKRYFFPGSINTDNKRRSVMGFGGTTFFPPVYPVPDTTIQGADRRHAYGLYRGPELGAEYTQLLTSTQAQTVSLKRDSQRSLSVAQTSSPALQRLSSRIFGAVQSKAATVVKLPGLNLSSAQGQASNILLSAQILLTTAQVEACTLLRGVLRQMLVTQGSTATLQAIKVALVQLSAVQAQVASLLREARRNLEASEGTGALLERSMLWSRNLSQNAAATVSRHITLKLDASITQAVLFLKVRDRLLSVGQSSDADIALRKLASLVIAQAQTITLMKQANESLLAGQSSVATLARILAAQRILETTQGESAALAKVLGRILAAQEGSSSALTRQSNRVLAVAQATLALLLRFVLPVSGLPNLTARFRTVMAILAKPFAAMGLVPKPKAEVSESNE